MATGKEFGGSKVFEYPACNWWINEPSLLATGNPDERDLDGLWSKGFRVLVSLLDPAERSAYDGKSAEAKGWSLYSIPIKEGFAPSAAQMQQFVTLAAGLETASKLVTHCQSGLGRSALMAAAYWIARGRSCGSAIEYVEHASKDGEWLTDERRAALENFQRQRKR